MARCGWLASTGWPRRLDPCRSTRSDSTTRPRRSTCASGWRSRRTRCPSAARTDLAARRSRKRRSCRPATAPRSTSTAASREPVARWLESTHQPAAGDAGAVPLHAAARARGAHAFRVASGLDSMVLGEPQILGQMKQAVRAAECGGHARHRAEPAVPALVRGRQGSAHATPRSARIDLDGRRRGQARGADLPVDLSEQRVLFVGAGEMIELAATHFAARSPRSITVANRTLERGEQLARALRRRRDHADRAAASGCASSTSSSPARRARCRSSARACSSARQAAPARADVHGRPRACRATSSPRRRRSTTCSSTPSTTCADDRQGQPADPPRGRRAGRGDDRRRRRRTSCTGCDGRSVVPPIAALPAHHDELRAAELERAQRHAGRRHAAGQTCSRRSRAA